MQFHNFTFVRKPIPLIVEYSDLDPHQDLPQNPDRKKAQQGMITNVILLIWSPDSSCCDVNIYREPCNGQSC